MVVTTNKIIKLQGIYLDRYNSIGKSDLPDLLLLADEFDKFFLNDYVPFLESRLTIAGNTWQLIPESSEITVSTGRLLSSATAYIIVDGVNRWLMEPEDKPRIIEYYRSGVDLWRLNREALGLKYPRKIKLDKDDGILIEQYLGIFNDTFQNHLNKHIRTINRFVNTGQLSGWSTDQFIENCTCPDGHIIGFRYGNARYSWAEHLRRFGAARPKILAQAAQAERMRR